MGPRLACTISGVLTLVLSGCADDDGSSQKVSMHSAQTIEVTSSAFAAGDSIPTRFTCDGDDVSPPLAWTGMPKDTASLAVVVDDPDAPGGTFTHWVAMGFAPSISAMAENDEPAGAVRVPNSGGSSGYLGPCPPSGTHHYRFTVYALKASPGLGNDPALAEALDLIEVNAIAWGRLVATYAAR